MNNNFITGILGVLIAGLMGCMVAFGINAYQEISSKNEVNAEAIYNEIEKKEDIEVPQVVEQSLDDVSDTFSSNVSYQSSSSQMNYFYNQLDSYSKTIYDGLVANKDNMKTGTAQIDYGNTFSSILSGTNGQDELSGYYQSAIEAFTYDNPEVFYLDPTKMYLNIQSTTRGNNVTYNVYISNAQGSNYLAQGFSSAEQINSCQRQIEQVKNQVISSISGNTYNKIKQVHDYLVDNIEYDQTTSKNNIYNLYGALVNKECVCEGYAKAMKYLLDEAGVDNVIVLGTGINSNGTTENHAWNYVAIDGSWYAVDSTWDDPIVQGGGTLPSSYKYRYFLKGSNTMRSDHSPNGQFTQGGKVFNYPSISSSDFE